MIESLMTQSVSVQPYLGEGAIGSKFDTPRTVACYVEEVSRLVAGPDAEQSVAIATVFAATGSAGDMPVGSKVTLPTGRIGRVAQVNTFTAPGGFVGAAHLEVTIGSK